MTALAAPSFRAWPGSLAPERNPRILALATTASGRVALLFLYAALLEPFTSLWPAIVAATAAIAFSDRRHAQALTALATLAVFLLAPDWYGAAAPAVIAERAGLSNWLTPLLRWGAPGLVLGFAALFLAAVRAGRPRFVARHPFLSLLAVFVALLTAAIAGPGGAEVKVWLWSLAAALSGYMWFIALVATEQRGAQSRVPFWRQFAAMHPFWGSTGVPYTLAPGKLAKIADADDDAFAISQIKGLKLLAWAYILLMIGRVYGELVHERLGIPAFPDALTTFLGPGLAWHMRWLSLCSEFFEAVIRIAAMGHAIIGSARLAGYNLLRNTYRPFSSRSIAEFWGRYYYYFKELLLTLFYFPAYLGYFRSRPKLRAAFATFMAAGVGNGLFHFIRELDKIATLGVWRAVVGYQTYAFYCLILPAGIFVSQLGGSRRDRADDTIGKRMASFVGVMGFFCLLQVFADTGRTLTLADHMRFFVSLFLPSW